LTVQIGSGEEGHPSGETRRACQSERLKKEKEPKDCSIVSMLRELEGKNLLGKTKWAKEGSHSQGARRTFRRRASSETLSERKFRERVSSLRQMQTTKGTEISLQQHMKKGQDIDQSASQGQQGWEWSSLRTQGALQKRGGS